MLKTLVSVRNFVRQKGALTILILIFTGQAARAAGDDEKSPPATAPTTSPVFVIPKDQLQSPALPKEFAFAFSWGYGEADTMPADPAKFEEMLVNLKSDGFNVVHCIYRDWRPALFKKHGMKMMIDVLAWKNGAEMDIRKEAQRPAVEKIAREMRDSDAIWGYNLWNERADEIGAMHLMDLYVRMLRTWDPTHPVWVGTYRTYYASHYATPPGCVAYYDYHWKRGLDWHFKDLNSFKALAEKRNSTIGMWEQISDYEKNLYTMNTSIAYGTKTLMWFIGGPYDIKTRKWDPDHFLGKIGRDMQSMYGVIGEMGRPVAVYSTPTTRDAAGKEKEPGIPDHTTAFPGDWWLQAKKGEVLCGFFKLPDHSDVVYIANHNAYAEQDVELALSKEKKAARISRFDRPTGKWVELKPGDLKFKLAPADAEALRFESKPADENAN